MIAGSQGGKGITLVELVPIEDSYTTIGEIKVGDRVFGSDGKLCNVTYVSPVHHLRCFEVEIDNGQKIIVDEEHLWKVKSYKHRKNENRSVKDPDLEFTESRWQCRLRGVGYEVLDTLYMSKHVIDAHGGSNYSIDLCEALEIEDKVLPIMPYTFGAWLGNGVSDNCYISCWEPNNEVIRRINIDGYPTERFESSEDNKCWTYAIGGKEGGRRIVNPILKSMDVLHNKHIPMIYKRSSIEQRLQLVRGMLDTDGYIDPRGHIEYCSIREKLANDFLEVVRSLGIKAKIRTKIIQVKSEDYNVYLVTFNSNKYRFFWLDRKYERQSNKQKPNTNLLYIVSIKEVESVPTKCIAVDSYDHTFLGSGAFITLHNTSFGPWWLQKEIYDIRGSGDYIAATASFDLFKLKMLPAMLQVYEQILGIGRYWAGDRIIELKDPKTGEFLAKRSQDPMWARIILRSADALGGLESSTAKGAWLDECLSPETIISTELGEMQIGRIVNHSTDVRVWSYDTKLHKFELRRINRWIKLPQSKPLLQLGSLRITADHKVWTENGYIESEKVLASFEHKLFKMSKVYGSFMCGEWIDVPKTLNPSECDLSSDGFVYNIEVEGNHNYVAGGILVSNCGQERFGFDAFKAIRRRIALHVGRILMTTTLYNLGWLIDAIIEPAISSGQQEFFSDGIGEIEYTDCESRKTAVIQFDSILNPSFPVEEYEEQRKLLSDEEFNMQYRGRKASRRILIYSSFSPTLHKCDPFEIPDHWKRYLGLDFGPVHTCCMYYAEDPISHILYCYREYLAGGRTIADHVKHILAGERGVPLCVGGAGSEGQWRMEFGSAGLPVYKPQIIDVNLGINRVYAQHQNNGIMYFGNVSGIIDEKGKYRRKMSQAGETLDEIAQKNIYHRLDAERYIISWIRPGYIRKAKVLQLGD